MYLYFRLGHLVLRIKHDFCTAMNGRSLRLARSICGVTIGSRHVIDQTLRNERHVSLRLVKRELEREPQHP